MKQARYASATLGFALTAIAALGLSGCGLFGPPEVINENHTGTLAAGDTVNSTDGSFQDDYTIRVEQGWVITAVLSAPTFDPYVWILSPNQASAQQLGSQPGTHAVTLTHTAETSGAFIVRANSNTAGQTGEYTLSIQAGPPGSAAAVPGAPAAAPAAPAAP